MAQHDFGGSCTAQRYCHSEARISGHVVDEHGGLSENRATMMELTFWVRNRQSSYNHSVLSTFSGACASLSAISRSTGIMLLEPMGCVRKLCSAFKCSVSWKAESICNLSVFYLHSTACRKRTSDRSTSGGPSAISSALVPGRILLSAAWSRELLNSFCCSGEADTGDSWSSGMGGGLGSRGDAGDAMFAKMA